MSEVSALLAKVLRVWGSPQTLGSLAVLTTLLVLLPRLRRDGPRSFAELRARGFRTDLAYTALYLGGIYAFFVSGPVFRLLDGAVTRGAPWLRLGLLDGAPAVVQFLALLATMDFVVYWTHRASHAVPWLWAIHAVHHSQDHLGPLTNFRFHVADVLLRTLVQYPFALAIGVPASVWVPTVWLQTTQEALAHADLDWSYGPLEWLLVSPRWHRVHHAAEPSLYATNFGISSTLWDRLFDTEAPSLARPRAYGTPGLGIPESFAGQVAYPLLAWLGTARARDAA